MKIRRFLTLLLILSGAIAAVPLCGAAATGFSPEAHWRAAERACYGDLECMARTVKEAPPVPWLRGWDNPEELFDALKKAHRFQTLGLSEAEGRQLLRVIFDKMERSKGSVPSSTDAPAKPASLASFLQPPAFPYRAPAEFEPLGAVLFRWPYDWVSMQPFWARMIDVCARAGVKAAVWVSTPAQQQAALAFLQQQGVPTNHIRWVVVPTNTVWIRDYGPQIIASFDSPQWGVVDFHYSNGRKLDDKTPLIVALGLQLPYVDRQHTDVVYTEGGNLNHDGLGAVVYSQRTYKRNPGVSPSEIDRRILSAFQAVKGLVLIDLSLDGTGHVDMFMKIVRPDTVLVGQYKPDQVDYEVLENNAALLAQETNGQGDPWRVVRIVQPDIYYAQFLLPVVRTYTNSLMINNFVVVPVYGIPEDDAALAVYREVLPGKTLVPLDAREIIPSGGAWHCVTMEVAVPTPGEAP